MGNLWAVPSEAHINPTTFSTTTKNADGVQIEWSELQALAVAGVHFPDIARKYNLKEPTIRKRAQREKWATPWAIAKKVQQIQMIKSENEINLQATNWVEKGEAHRKKAFEIASESVKKFQPKAPRNFRELEAADKIARRAAGLDVSEVNQTTLIQMNERMDNFADEQPEEIIIETEVIPNPQIEDQTPETPSEPLQAEE